MNPHGSMGIQARVRTGTVLGTTDGSVNRFLGVPYAAAPFGDLRFHAPQPHPVWDAPWDATQYGPTAPQHLYDPYLEQLIGTTMIPGEEVLNLNVWTPAQTPAGGAPVLVWMHGGSLTHGSNAKPVYDGTRFAARGITFVSVNYRLGMEGFSVLDGAALNLGLADQLAALEWVRDEISNFGGNPAEVTVMGQSAGGATVAALIASPKARGLVRQAIIQSGPLLAVPAQLVRRTTELIAGRLGILPTREAFAKVSPNAVLAAQSRVLGDESPLDGGPSFQLVLDDDLVPELPWEALRRGVADDVVILTGVTSSERRLWTGPNGAADSATANDLETMRVKMKLPEELIGTYRRILPEASDGELLGAITGDLSLRGPMLDVAEARAARGACTYVYEFDWPSPVMGLGAAHSVDLAFVFGNLSAARSMIGDDAPTALAEQMNEGWSRFVLQGSPGWGPWDDGRRVRHFSASADAPVRTSDKARCQALLAVARTRRLALLEDHGRQR